MLLYYNGCNTWRHLVQLFGSMFYKWQIFSIGVLVAAAIAVLQVLENSETNYTFTLPHQYPHQVLGGIVTFALVFRINQAWARYWEAITNLHFMYSKWADSFSQFCAFTSVTLLKTRDKGGADANEKCQLLEDMNEKVENDFLLLSAMACDRICRGDCARMERRHELGFGWKKLVVLREDLRRGEDLTNFKGMPKFRVSSCSRENVADDEKLDDIEMKSLWDAEYVVRKPPKDAKLELLQVSSDRCNMVVNWLNHNLAYCASMLETPPPIQSRMYQEISNGMLGFNNVMKIADVPFCFPYNQIILILLHVWTAFVPFYVMSFTESLVAGPILGFVLTTFMFALNNTARELENPFGLTANKICVPEFHSRFALVVRDAVRSCNHPPRPPRARKSPSGMRRYTSYGSVIHEDPVAMPKLDASSGELNAEQRECAGEDIMLGNRLGSGSNAGQRAQSNTWSSGRLNTSGVEDLAGVSFDEHTLDLESETDGKTSLASRLATLQVKSSEQGDYDLPSSKAMKSASSIHMQLLLQQLAEVSESVELHLRSISCYLKNIPMSGSDLQTNGHVQGDAPNRSVKHEFDTSKRYLVQYFPISL